MPADDEPLARVAKEVSDALLASDADLLMAVESLTPVWAAELDAARDGVRQQQTAVLSRRVDLRNAFSHGASLAEALGPAPRDRHASQPPSPISALAASEPAAAALALRNISHTLHLVRFLTAAPVLIAAATEMLDRVAEAAPASSDLFQAHENIYVCERVRDYTLLDALPHLNFAGQVSDIFAGIEPAREQLEHYLMANIFSAVPRYAQTDPRVLVAAVRIVQRDVEEDDWWEEYLERHALKSAGALVRPYGRRDYEQRMHHAIVKSIEHTFSKRPARTSSVDATLQWIKRLVVEEQETRRFVVPCFPPSYEVGDLFITEHHRCIMAVVTDLFRATGDRPAEGGEEDSEVVKIVEWYREYRWGPSGASLAASSLKLPTGQRNRLVAAVARHGRAKLLAKVEQVVKMDEASIIWHKRREEPASSSSSGDIPLGISVRKEADTGVCTTAGPERVFGAVGQQIKDGRVLGVPDVNTALAQIVTLVLNTYLGAVRDLIDTAPPSSMAEEDYVCATANNMARCLEYAEELREAVSPFVVDASRTVMEEEFEDVIDGFRDVATVAVGKLVDGVSADVTPLTRRFFAPRTGTEVMLDVIEILTDYFGRYEMSLMPYHFEVFAGGCLRQVVAQYLAPFIALGSVGKSGDGGGLSQRSGLSAMAAEAVVAQMHKDAANLFGFFREHVKVLEKKHVDAPAAAVHGIVALMTCRPTTQVLAATHVEAAATVARLGMGGLAEDGGGLALPIEASEAIWRLRSDVNGTTILDAVIRARSCDHFHDRDDVGGPDGCAPRETEARALLTWSPGRQ
jgi:hypothetical protein